MNKSILLIILLGANVYNFYIMLIPVFFTIISAVVYIIEGKNYIND